MPDKEPDSEALATRGRQIMAETREMEAVARARDEAFIASIHSSRKGIPSDADDRRADGLGRIGLRIYERRA
jgi:hypothetical protein